MSTPTDTEAREALAKIALCNELDQSEPWQRLILPFIEEKRAYHLEQGVNVKEPAAVRAEHHRAYLLADEMVKFIDKTRDEMRVIAERYRDANKDFSTSKLP